MGVEERVIVATETGRPTLYLFLDGKKPEVGQLKHLITAKPRVGYRLNLSIHEVRVVK